MADSILDVFDLANYYPGKFYYIQCTDVFAFAAKDRGHFMCKLRVHISSTAPDRYESGWMSNLNQYSVNSSLVPH